MSDSTLSPTPSHAFHDRDLAKPGGSQDLKSAPQTTHQLIKCEVSDAQWVQPRLRRITLSAEEFRHWKLSGPDECVAVLLASTGKETAENGHKTKELHLPPTPLRQNLRAAVAEMPADKRPDLRWFTTRAVNPTAGTMTIDAVVPPLPNPGPGIRWAASTTPGEEIGLWNGQANWFRGGKRQLLVADSAAAPAAAAIIDFLSAHHPAQLANTHLALFAAHPEELDQRSLEQLRPHIGSMTIRYTPAERFSAAWQELIAGSKLPWAGCKPDFVWVGAEGELCTSVRHSALEEWAVDKENFRWCPYWFIGKARP